MRSHIVLILIIINTLPISGCDKISEKLGFSQPGIVSVYPSNNTINVPSDAIITVEFSKSMDKTKTNSEFSLTSSQGQVSGFFTWPDNKTLTFRPKELLFDSNVYTITISSNAEDSEGNDLKETYESVFYTNADLVRPGVTAYSLSYIGGAETPDHTGVSPDTLITINFSEGIDVNTLYDGFSISPAVQGTFLWNTARTSITFDPLYSLDYGTNYTVTLNENIEDIYGNQLIEQYSFNFTVGNDFEKPGLISIRQDPPGASPDPALYRLNNPWNENLINCCIEKQNDIVITFSEPVRDIGIYNAISISPAVDFYISSAQANIVRLGFNEPMESEENYTLKIASTITDLQENPLDKEYNFNFYTNSINSISPVAEYITDPVHYTDAGYAFPAGWTYPPPVGAAWTFGEIETLTLTPPDSYPGIHIIFSANMIRESIGMSIEKIIGSSAASWKIINPDWSALAPAGSRVYKIEIQGIDAGNIYKLTLKGGKSGARDINNNYMKEDFVQYIKF